MKLKIASINIWGLPWPFSVDKEKRLKRLADLIMNESLTIIALQEIWLNWDINALKKKLTGYYFYSSHNALFNPSGLLYISKIPLKKIRYHPFPSKKGFFVPYFGDNPEFPSKKGILISKMMIDSKLIILINTHLTHSSDPSKSKIMQNQMKFLLKFLNNNPSLIFGDFNIININDIPLPKDIKIISKSDSPTRSLDSHYSRKLFNKFEKINKVCDLILSNFKTKIIEKKILYAPQISDHCPVIMEIEI
ncbi:MAG: endonuclease/exonuclease/phosphatase family protein [Nanoarchaeota archaeon]|nr:endonuclease/exonuclease/phosphatase family protein [Nanoarchaeota archaeon]